jgi:predicted phage terminase large subunit-like protein
LEERRKEIGSIRFEQEYNNNPMPDEIAVYREPWFREYRELPVPESELFIVGGVDIGVRHRDVNDPSALVVYGRVKSGPHMGKIYCLHHATGRWTVFELIENMLVCQKRWPHMAWAIETIQAQYTILQIYRKAALEKGFGYVHVWDYQVKQDKVTRARANQAIFEQGWVHFRRDQRDLVEELLIFPQGEHDDLVDATSMAMFGIQDHYREAPHMPTLKQAKPRTWADELRDFRRYQELSLKFPSIDPATLWLYSTLS